MRYRLAMADGGGHEAVTGAAWFAPLIGLGSSAVTATALWLAQRVVGKAAWQAAMSAANKDMIDQLQEERKSLREERAEERRMWAEERLKWAAERSQLSGDVINLTQALESLKSWLRREGIQVPESAYHPPTEMLVLEGGKSREQP
jgi:hypothetical protein